LQALESPRKWVWSWKVLEILVKGPGKSWNLLGYGVGGGHNDAGADAIVGESYLRFYLYI